LCLGNLEAQRDWGHAKDYVRAMHLLLQQEEPEDFVVATGESHSVREFCELAFAEVGLDYRDYVVKDEKFYRPAEVESLLGDSKKAHAALGWQPQYTFPQLVRDMVHNDLAEHLRRASDYGDIGNVIPRGSPEVQPSLDHKLPFAA